MPRHKHKTGESMQVSLFEQEMLRPVDLHKAPPAQVDYAEEQRQFVERHQGHRPHILLNAIKSCPVCGTDWKLAPDGTVRCPKCWWWQSLNE